MKQLDDYKDYWLNLSEYVLGPSRIDKTLIVYGKMGIDYVPVSLPDEWLPQIIEKMKAAGAQIFDEMPNDAYEDWEKHIRHYWTGRLHEFALVLIDPNLAFEYQYAIYQYDRKEYVVLFGTDRKEFARIVRNMLDAGVTVLDKKPDYDSTG